MIKEAEIFVNPDKINDHEYQKYILAKKMQVQVEDIHSFKITRKSIDARKHPVFRLRIAAFMGNDKPEVFTPIEFKEADKNKRVVIVGAGPAGMFAALRLLELGIKPIIVDRGKNVRDRRRDLRAIQQDHIVDPDSNYCFGEGGAGTYSDGKLYTRSVKRGNVDRILKLLVQHGAQEEILIDAHPHIGSNNLPKVVESIRETILKHGGEIHFESKVTDFIVENNTIRGVIVNEKDEFLGDSVILATGHSARDIYYLLHKKNILIEQKPFAMGVRIEHPQALIDSIQYRTEKRHENLPASSYNLACQVDERGVYSFCMCPGGIIVPASTDKNELVLNGMSISRRDSPFANSGIVVSIEERDWKKYNQSGVFAGLALQQSIERRAFEAGGRTQTAPAQRVTDFVDRKVSSSLPETSYIPGVTSAALHDLFPGFIGKRLRRSLIVFNKKMKGFISEEAQILAAETRTSSPIRIPRDKETFEHPQIKGLYPVGEGAGYAGGIMSAAIDGERAVDAMMVKR
ncbi:MAG: FAD-dependent monooxygenase [Melioribacteraceae bacterium]|nr:FAD-dependent monooxygenase [Melioribacteraceae bacterium]